MESEEGELEAVINAKLVEDVGDVMLDRLLADAELLGDILIRKSGNNRLHDFHLPGSQPEIPGRPLARRLPVLLQGLHQVRNRLAPDPVLPLQ